MSASDPIDDVVRWINDLDAPVLARRQAAEQALLEHAELARPLLRNALTLDDRPLLVAQAALLLVALRDGQARGPLLRAARAHAHADLRAILVGALADLVEPAALDDAERGALQALAQDAALDVRAAAQRALARQAPAALPLAPQVAAPVLEVAAEDLASFAELAAGSVDADLRHALRQAAHAVASARQPAEQQLLQAGPRGQKVLIEALADPVLAVRAAAVRLLQQRPTPEASGGLLLLAASGGDGAAVADLRAMALRALAASLTGSEQHIVDDLTELSHDADRFVRAAAAAALGGLPFAESAQALLALLVDGDSFVVEEAARALARTGVPATAVEAVADALELVAPRCQAPLLRALVGPLAPARLDDVPRVRLLRIARGHLQSGEPERATAALGLLDRLHAPPALLSVDDASRVAALLEARDPAVRAAALALLASHARPDMAQVARAVAAVDAGEDEGLAALLLAVQERLAPAAVRP